MRNHGVKEMSLGFAAYYLIKCEESKSEDEIDIQVYTQLMEVDSRLGLSAAEQLYACLFITTRSDIIKVLFEDF